RWRHLGAAIIDIHPYRLDLELGDIAEAQVSALACGVPVDPGLEHAVFSPRFTFLAQRIELAVHFNAIPAIIPQGWVELEYLAVFAFHVRVVTVVANLGCIGAGFLEMSARGPAVGAVDLPATPAGLPIIARYAWQLATIGGVSPVGIEL